MSEPEIVIKLTKDEAELIYNILVERMFNHFKPIELTDDDYAVLDMVTDFIDAQT